jgi:hypothetical protein
MMHSEFDERTVANMEVALARNCEKLPASHDDYENRKIIADAILECARSGITTLGDLTLAGQKALQGILGAR